MRPDVDLQVAYCTLRGAEAAHDPEFGATVKWDVPLLDGYPWQQVPNRGSGAETFLGLRNSGLWRIIREGSFDAILCYVSYRRATFWIARLAAKLSGAAFLFGTDTTTLTPLDGRMWKRSVKRVMWPMLFRLADQVIVPSTGSLELMKSLGLPEERVTITPYVVDNDWWLAQSAKVDREATRRQWGAGSRRRSGAVLREVAAVEAAIGFVERVREGRCCRRLSSFSLAKVRCARSSRRRLRHWASPIACAFWASRIKRSFRRFIRRRT